jgi:dTMP kinase
MLGKFITIDGIEGAGKSTQIELIADFLKANNQKFILTREPGGTDFGEKVRSVLLDESTGSLDGKTEALMMFAARNEHILQKIIPNLEKDIWVISDRFSDSSYAYQGGGRGLDFLKIAELENWVLGDFKPDLSLFLNIDLKTSNERVNKRGAKDRFEKENNEFFIGVYNGYQKLIKENPQRIKNIDASGSVQHTWQQVEKELSKLLKI